MAITLTKNYQRISTISLSYGEIRTYAKYSSQSQTANTTNYQIKSTYYTYQAGGVSFSSATASLDGTEKNYGYTTMPYGETTIQEMGRVLNHNSNGTSPTKNVTTSWSASFGGSGSTTGSFVAPKINRISQITSFNGTDIEGDFSATYQNYVSSYTQKLRISIPQVQELMKIDNYTNGQVVQLNQTSIDYIKNYMNTNGVSTVKIEGAIETWSGNTRISQLADEQRRVNVCSFSDANPTLTYTKQETNANVISVLGTNSADTVIKNVSKINFVVTPVAKKGATISSVTITHDNIPYTKRTSPYEFQINVKNNTFNIVATDVRKLSSETTVVRPTLINYETVLINSFNFIRQNPTSPDLYLNADIRYYQQTFNQTVNVPTIQWQCVEKGQDLDPNGWNTLSSSDYAIDTTNNKITIPATGTHLSLTNVISYKKEGELYLKVNDLLTEYSNHMAVIKGIPTMDLGEHDLCVNGELYIADEDRENKFNVKDLGKRFFSTTETVVGEWDDGKPIYRKLFRGTLPNTSAIVTQNLQSDVDELVAFGGYIYQSDGVKFSMPSTNPSGSPNSNVTQTQFSRLVILTNGTLRLDCSNNFKQQQYAVWAEYTKTSD